MKQNTFKEMFLLSTPVMMIILALYIPVITWLVERYTAAESYYGHGFLIPFISGYLVWRRKTDIDVCRLDKSTTVVSDAIYGTAICILSAAVWKFSIVTNVHFPGGLSLIAMLFGVSLFLYGRRITKILAFPILYLLFAIPLPLVALNAVGFPLRMMATKTAVIVLQPFIPIAHSGFILQFPHDSLVVGGPCSGMRSIVAFLAITVLMASFSKAGSITKGAFILGGMAVAVASNAIRLIVLCLITYYAGSNSIHGFVHDATGYGMFLLSLVFIVYMGRKLNA